MDKTSKNGKGELERESPFFNEQICLRFEAQTQGKTDCRSKELYQSISMNRNRQPPQKAANVSVVLINQGKSI
jgi:hypothetical protein